VVPEDQDFTSVGSRRKLPEEGSGDRVGPEDQDFTIVGSRRKLPQEGSGDGVGPEDQDFTFVDSRRKLLQKGRGGVVPEDQDFAPGGGSGAEWVRVILVDQDLTSVWLQEEVSAGRLRGWDGVVTEDQDFTSVGSRRKLSQEGSGCGVG
jgi:hypothetical protein